MLNSLQQPTERELKIESKLNLTGVLMKIKLPDTTQEGLESEIKFLGNNQSLSLISHFAKSRTDSNGPNSRRPDLSYGIDYSAKFTLSEQVLSI